MANDNINVQLGSLDFNGIKNSIIRHLKQQNTLKDYDYDGSAMQVLLDVLAYNTLYYGFYSNMIASEMFLDTAQKESSIISLVKPLGYLVPGAKSARALVKLRQAGGGGDVPLYTKFSGHNEGGVSYNFYTIENYSLDTNGEAVVQVVQGKSLIKEQPLLINENTQKGFILGLDVDISTIRVEVLDSEGDGVWEEWGRASNIESGLDDSSHVYWLERSDLGFFVIFGGNLESSSSVQMGRSLKPNDIVRVSYLKSDGERGNSIGNFQVSGFSATTNTITLSSGGSDKPDLESIKFFAPKWFAAQDRAVTVEDCRALLAKEGFVSDSPDPHSKFNVWGGEEMDPPRYGRLFVSLSDTTEEDPVAASRAIDILEQKTCVTILPEFIDVGRFEVGILGSLYYEPLDTPLSEDILLSNAIGEIFKIHSSGFNRKYDTGEIANHINSTNKAFRVNPNDLRIIISNDVSVIQNRPKDINFRTKCRNSLLYSSEFIAAPSYHGDIENPDNKISLRVSNGSGSVRLGKPINAYYTWNGLNVNLGNVGYFIPQTGKVVFTKSFASEGFSLYVQPSSEGTQSFRAKEEMFTETRIDLSIARRNVN